MTNPRVRSYHARRGRLGPSLHESLETLLPRYGVPVGPPLDPSALFDPPLPVVLEIGCGMGDATLQSARADSDTGILAVDVHTRGIASLLRAINDEHLTNIRVALGDAMEVVDALPPQSLAIIRVWFPDPWPKARHHKRRLLQAPAVALLASRLVSGGTLHAATDWPEYAEQILEVFEAEPALVNRYPGYAPRPASRPFTRYEQVGLEAGRPVADIVYERR